MRFLFFNYIIGLSMKKFILLCFLLTLFPFNYIAKSYCGVIQMPPVVNIPGRDCMVNFEFCCYPDSIWFGALWFTGDECIGEDILEAQFVGYLQNMTEYAIRMAECEYNIPLCPDVITLEIHGVKQCMSAPMLCPQQFGTNRQGVGILPCGTPATCLITVTVCKLPDGSLQINGLPQSEGNMCGSQTCRPPDPPYTVNCFETCKQD